MKPLTHRWKDAVALAVHKAVTDYTGTSGLGNCDLYALAGMLLLRDITKLTYQIQLGSLMYLADPAGHGWFEINARDGGLDRLEYHAWLGRAGTVVKQGQGLQPSLHEIGELIDFSVRHFRSMTEQMQQVTSATKVSGGIIVTVDPGADRVTWTRPDGPPDYLWTEGNPPDEYRYTPDEACMLSYYGMLKQRPYVAMELKKLALFHYGQLLEIQENNLS